MSEDFRATVVIHVKLSTLFEVKYEANADKLSISVYYTTLCFRCFHTEERDRKP